MNEQFIDDAWNVKEEGKLAAYHWNTRNPLLGARIA